MKPIQLGFMDNGNRIYSVYGLAPTIPTCGGGIQPKILEIRKIGLICSFNISGSQNFGLSAIEGGKQHLTSEWR